MSRPIVVSALIIIGVIFVVLFASAIQSHHHVRLIRTQLDQAIQQVAQSQQDNANLATSVANLEMELDEAKKSRSQIQDSLNKANSTIEQLRKDVDAAQSQLKEKDAHTQELTNELEKTKKET